MYSILVTDLLIFCLQVIINKLWFGLSLKEAIERPRLHHQLYPNTVFYENDVPYKVPQAVLDGLEALGHKVQGRKMKYCAAQGVYRSKLGQLFGKSDPRKTGVAVVLSGKKF